LQGLAENRCPECGRQFDPADRSTMALQRRIPARFARYLSLPGRWFHRLVLATAICWLVVMVPPGGMFPFDVLLFFCWVLLGLIWLVRIGLAVVIATSYRQRLLRDPSARRRLVTAPVIVLV